MVDHPGENSILARVVNFRQNVIFYVKSKSQRFMQERRHFWRQFHEKIEFMQILINFTEKLIEIQFSFGNFQSVIT